MRRVDFGGRSSVLQTDIYRYSTIQHNRMGPLNKDWRRDLTITTVDMLSGTIERYSLRIVNSVSTMIVLS